MEFITHLPTVTVFTTNMAAFAISVLLLGGIFGQLLAMFEARVDHDPTWELHMQRLTMEYWTTCLDDLSIPGPRPWEADPTWGASHEEELVFSQAALSVFEEMEVLAQGRRVPPPHLPENLKGVRTLEVLSTWPLTDWHYKAAALARVHEDGLNW